MKRITLLACASVFALAPLAAMAQSATATDVQRDVNQRRRIEQGVKSGALTNRETGRLEGREDHIARDEANAGANGHVTAHEQRRIQMAENRDSRQIQRQKHNDHWGN